MDFLAKIKTQAGKVIPSIFTSSKPEQTKNDCQQIENRFCSSVIDDIVFSLKSLKSNKERENFISQLVKTYNDSYVQKSGSKRLCLEIVGKKYFLYVKITNQTQYNHDSEAKANIRYKNLVEQIYSNPEDMRHFWGIEFPRLKVLNISGHNLRSIQGITFMDLPNLECLELHSNNLVSIDCLSKVSLPKLKTITLYNNKISFCDNLVRGNFPMLRNFEFDKSSPKKETLVESVDFLFKMKNPFFIQKIYMHNDGRILKKKRMDIMQGFWFKRVQIKLPATYFLEIEDEAIFVERDMYLD